MPLYEYECSECGNQLEIKQGYHDSPKKKCPECKRFKLKRVISCPHFSVVKGKSEIKTLGHLANRNREKMGLYEFQEKDEKRKIAARKGKKEAAIPFWRDKPKVDTSLAQMSETQKKKYIETGER